MKLYHGSDNTNIEKFAYNYINSDFPRDFGKGVYFTSSLTKAIKWACKKNEIGAVYEIEWDVENSILKTKDYCALDDDLYYLFYLGRINLLKELGSDFISGFDDFDVISGPVLSGKSNGSMEKYVKLAEDFNEGNITFEDLRKNTRLFDDKFVQWCFRSKKSIDFINKNLTNKSIYRIKYELQSDKPINALYGKDKI